MRDGRLIDLPYHDSPPLLWTYRQSAALTASGTYTFGSTKAPFTPDRPILGKALYVFHSLAFTSDLDPVDFLAASGASGADPLGFTAYMESDALSPKMREPVTLVNHFASVSYILSFLGEELVQGQAYPGAVAATVLQSAAWNKLQGLVSGTLIQVPALIGKGSVNVIMTLIGQEVLDTDYVAAFVRGMRAARGGAVGGRQF